MHASEDSAIDALRITAYLVALALPLFPVIFGITFPYSLCVFELYVFFVFLASLVFLPYRRSHLLAVSILLAGFAVHLLFLAENLALFNPLGSHCLGSLTTIGIDLPAATDSFRRGLAYFLVFLLALRISERSDCASVLYRAIALTAVLLLFLGVVAPHDSKRILWLYATHTFDADWLSPSLNNLQSSMSGYVRQYVVDGIPLRVDNKLVSGYPIGPVLNENQYMAAIGASLPVLLGWTAERWSRSHSLDPIPALMGLATVICGLVLYLTHSRGGAIALTASMLSFYLASKNRVLVLPYSISVALGIAGVIVLVPLYQLQATSVFEPGRAAVWLEAIKIFLTHPLLGVGLGNFSDLRIGFHEATMGPLSDTTWYSAHNVYLQLLTEVGLVGVVFVTALCIVSTKGRRSFSASRGAYLYAGLFASLIYSGTHAVFDYSPGMPFNAVLTAAVGGLFLGKRHESEGAGTPYTWRFERRIAAASVAVMLLIFAVGSVRYCTSELRIRSLKTLVAQLLTQSGDASTLEKELRAKVLDGETSCAPFALSKDFIRAMADANLMLSRSYGRAYLEKAAQYFAQYQAIGRYDAALLPTQVAIGQRLAAP